ncbi:hypothetical protein [Streptomyces sp. S.PB5]|uniref:Rv1733c family protein n=1 Tax=Streptomyces sp. S.PB5 TaxID=3020844 RepID=UPI0025AF72A6|nr:hypothetical protein [Streptomyces sp. S.PB5]MDN3027825.1 hypothetical protein [Streptomyces sp. S.PB5]
MTGPRRLGWRFRRSPLRRPSYLVEAWLLIATWTLAVVAAVVTGTLTARAIEQNINGLRAERHAVSAVLTEDAELSPSAAEGSDGGRAWATVRWTGQDGRVRTGVARVEPGTKAGSPTRIWLDTEGRLVPAPATPDQAELHGTALGTVAAVGAGSAVLLAGWSGCARLDRRRLAQWDKEWADFDPRWGHRTG